jgi:hypothetical protein
VAPLKKVMKMSVVDGSYKELPLLTLTQINVFKKVILFIFTRLGSGNQGIAKHFDEFLLNNFGFLEFNLPK